MEHIKRTCDNEIKESEDQKKLIGYLNTKYKVHKSWVSCLQTVQSNRKRYRNLEDRELHVSRL